MRIALLTFEYPPETGSSDQAMYTYYHARALARLGHEVQVFAGAGTAEDRTVWDGPVAVSRFHHEGRVQRLGDELSEIGLGRVGIRVSQGADTVTALLREHREQAFDVIEVSANGGEASLLALGPDVPTIVRLDTGPTVTSDSQKRVMDRLITRAVENLGIEAAGGVVASSQWMLDQVRRRVRVQRPAVVIPSGIELLPFDEHSEVDLAERFGITDDRFIVLCPDVQEDPQQRFLLSELVLDTLNRHTEQVTFVFAGQSPRRALTDWLTDELEPAQLETGTVDTGTPSAAERCALMKRADVVLLTAGRQSCPLAALEAMAASRAILAPDGSGVSELIRAEVDGLLARRSHVPSFRGELNLLIRNDDLRRTLGKSARNRIEAEFTSDHIAKRVADFYAFTIGRSVSTPVSTRQPSRLFGPENWFDMWWLNRTQRVTPAMARDAAGRPGFASVSLDELRFIDTIVTRIWVEEQAQWDTPEWRFAKQIHELYLDRTARERETEEVEESLRIALPPLTHPIFEETRAAYFVDEMWRVDRRPQFREWLEQEVCEPEFFEAAKHRLHLRRLAVAAANYSPSPGTYETLAKIYRRQQTHDKIVQSDRAYFESCDKGREFEQQINRLGLHAPLQRPRVFSSRRKRKPDDVVVSDPAKVTVLIPAYKHEAFIEDAMESVLDQSFTNLRLLVVDDLSPDGTLEAARRVEDPRVTVESNPTNLGLGNSIRRALEKIDTPYVALLNSDDLFHPDRLKQCIEVLEKDPDAAVVATGLVFVDGNGRKLTHETSCVVDVGPKTHAWLEWYTATTEQLAKRDDWIDLSMLLRHNHLATSSNIVLRKEFLEEHIADATTLKYCVDWQLFLLAAMNDQLRYIQKPLAAYRFHSSNTVWFEEGRADYVLEANAVVGHVLRRLWSQLSQGDPAAAREHVANLLREHASLHGETDGFVLYLGELTRQLEDRGDTQTGSELDLFAERALDRKTMEQIMARIDLPPWDLVGLSQQEKRHRIDAHVAEAFLTQSRRQAAELYGLRRQAEDERVLREKSERERNALRREHTVLRNENLILEQTRSRLASETHRLRSALDAERAWTRQAVDSLAEGRREQEEERAKHDEALADLERAHKADTADIVERNRAHEQAIADLQKQLEELEARRQAEIEELTTESSQEIERLTTESRDQLTQREEEHREAVGKLQSELEQRIKTHEVDVARITAEMAARDRENREDLTRFKEEQQRLAHERIRREQRGRSQLIEMMQQMHLEHEGRMNHLTHTHEWRAGRLLLRKLKLMGPWKTAVRASVLTRVGLERAKARLLGRGGQRVIIACDRTYPAHETDAIAWEARSILAAGFDVHVVCWGAGPTSVLEDRDLARRRHVLDLDGKLQRSDRRRFERRNPGVVAELDRLHGDIGDVLQKIFSLARSSEAYDAGYLHAIGSWDAMIMAHGAAKLLEVPYGVAISGQDVPSILRDMDRSIVVLREAEMVLADCRQTAEAIREALGIELPNLATKTPTVYWDGNREGDPTNGRLLATVSPTPSPEQLLLLAEAVKQAVELGADLGVELRESSGAHDALALLQQRVSELGLQDRFRILPEDAAPLEEMLESTSVLIAASQADGSAERFGLPVEVLAAMAAGVPIVASRGSALEDILRDEKDGLLVGAEDSNDLATALRRLAADSELRKRLGTAARQRFEAVYAPDLSIIDFRRRLKRLLSR